MTENIEEEKNGKENKREGFQRLNLLYLLAKLVDLESFLAEYLSVCLLVSLSRSVRVSPSLVPCLCVSLYLTLVQSFACCLSLCLLLWLSLSEFDLLFVSVPDRVFAFIASSAVTYFSDSMLDCWVFRWSH